MSKGWFGPKTIGWGISPSSWQGWVVTIVFLALFAAAMRWLRPVLETSLNLPPLALTFGITAVWLGFFSLVIWLTYDSRGAKR